MSYYDGVVHRMSNGAPPSLMHAHTAPFRPALECCPCIGECRLQVVVVEQRATIGTMPRHQTHVAGWCGHLVCLTTPSYQ